MAALAARFASKLGPSLAQIAKHADTIESVAGAALGEVEEDPMMYAPPPSTGTSMSTYFLFADIFFLLVGVILLVAANSKCASNPTGNDCKNHKNWGIAFTVICSICLIIILYFKLKG